MKSIFMTGTDTGIGKTYITVQLLKKFTAQGLKTFAMKPIASGCTKDKYGQWINDDAIKLQQAASIKKPYKAVNPFAFEDPIAPHLAAKKHGIHLSVDIVSRTILAHLDPEADVNIIEGIGGWEVPLNDKENLSDLVIALNIPVILVVGVKLGCLNHALLTANAIFKANVPVIGWVANCLEAGVIAIEENIETLRQRIPTACMGVVRYNDTIDQKIEIGTVES